MLSVECGPFCSGLNEIAPFKTLPWLSAVLLTIWFISVICRLLPTSPMESHSTCRTNLHNDEALWGSCLYYWCSMQKVSLLGGIVMWCQLCEALIMSFYKVTTHLCSYCTEVQSSVNGINTLRPRQDGCHFTNVSKCIFVNENVWILIKIIFWKFGFWHGKSSRSHGTFFEIFLGNSAMSWMICRSVLLIIVTWLRILVGDYINFTIAVGLIRLHMPGVKKSRV